jgi:hypothetical protein
MSKGDNALLRARIIIEYWPAPGARDAARLLVPPEPGEEGQKKVSKRRTCISANEARFVDYVLLMVRCGMLEISAEL